VMPFSLEKTLHIFNKTKTGGVQQVIVKDTSDKAQIELIQQHLSALAQGFKHGDFSGPQAIHGKAMAGLDSLSKNAADIDFNYQALINGAQINYSTTKPELISVIHQYFDAQLSDHARHAISNEHALHHNY
ncbi:MAG: aspartate carbamoyltransferase, partial [Methylococcaceae bacterium]